MRRLPQCYALFVWSSPRRCAMFTFCRLLKMPLRSPSSCSLYFRQPFFFPFMLCLPLPLLLQEALSLRHAIQFSRYSQAAHVVGVAAVTAPPACSELPRCWRLHRINTRQTLLPTAQVAGVHAS